MSEVSLVHLIEANMMWIFIIQILTIAPVLVWDFKYGIVYGLVSVLAWVGIIAVLLGLMAEASAAMLAASLRGADDDDGDDTYRIIHEIDDDIAESYAQLNRDRNSGT